MTKDTFDNEVEILESTFYHFDWGVIKIITKYSANMPLDNSGDGLWCANKNCPSYRQALCWFLITVYWNH